MRMIKQILEGKDVRSLFLEDEDEDIKRMKEILPVFELETATPEEILNRLVGEGNYEKRSDGKYDITGYGTWNPDIDLEALDISSLTELKISFGHVHGHFLCPKTLNKDLNGSPETVGGDFDCSHTKITSLIGAPERVGGDFNCSDTKITSLIGAPERVGGNFDCSNCGKKFKKEEVRAVCDVKGIIYV